MNRELYRYNFDSKVPIRDVEESLLLAVLATECLHGRALVRLDASFCLDSKKRSCVVDAATDVGRAIARIFTGFLSREFGEEAFKVERVGDAHLRDGCGDDHHLLDVEPVPQLPQGLRMALHPRVGPFGAGSQPGIRDGDP